MKVTKKKAYRMLLGTIAALTFGGASVAMAAPILPPTLDFGVIAPSAGSISYAGGIASLIGSGIQVDEVVGLDTPIGGEYELLNGALNFTTGAFVEKDDNVWIFSGGPNSSIVLSGTIDVNDNGVVDAADITGNLLAGSFVGQNVVVQQSSNYMVAAATFTDVKDPDLLALFGLPQDRLYSGNFNLSFNALSGNDSFSSTRVLRGDITNSPEVGS